MSEDQLTKVPYWPSEERLNYDIKSSNLSEAQGLKPLLGLMLSIARLKMCYSQKSKNL